MRAPPTRWLAALAVALGALGCASEGGGAIDASAASAPDAAVGDAVSGDWFVCASAACVELQTTGLRLAANHDVHHLTAAQSPFHEGDPYCVGEPFGTYAYRPGVLTLTLHGGALTVETDLVLDDGGVAVHDGDGDLHKVRENATGRWVDETCEP